MSSTDLLSRILTEWRNSEVERRRLLLLEAKSIERRWGLGQYRAEGAEIMRLLSDVEDDTDLSTT